MMAASIRQLVFPAARQASRRAAAKICTPRSFSALGSSQAELSTRRDSPEGDREHVEKDWEFDDFSTTAHGELERHREARQYARITAYEMPRLSGIPSNLWTYIILLMRSVRAR